MKFDVDLTVEEVTDGEHTARVQKVTYQEKIGEKWNNDGTTDVDADRWGTLPNEKRRIQIQLSTVGEKGNPINLFHEFYFTGGTPEKAKKAQEMSGRALAAMGVNITPEGFDPEEALNNEVGITITTEQTAGYSPKKVISKFYKA
jgi:hypothetical protein